MASRKQISQPGKIRNLGNFASCENFATLQNFLLCSNFFVFFVLLSFWSLICNAEFDSNSLCLDRLNNFGINSLEKLQN